MKTHLNVVGLIDLMAGALFTALGVLVPVGALLFAPAFYGARPWGPNDDLVVPIVLFIGAVFLALGIPNLVAGIGLIQHKGWARTLAIILAIVALASFPIGTGAGIYILWVLTQKQVEQPASGVA